MALLELLRNDRSSLAAAVVGLVFVAAGAVALSLSRGVAGVFLLLGGFTALMYIEYRHIEYE